MRVKLADEIRTGRAIDLREWSRSDSPPSEFGVSAVAHEIRGDDCCGEERGHPDRPLAIDCPTPGPVHEHVGAIRAGMDLSLRPALAAAARTRGHAPPQAEVLVEVRDRLDALDPPEIDLRAARRRVAEASEATDEAREEVAALRGRVAALRDADADHEAAESKLSEATRRLSEVETERIAAEQALARARDRATQNRERRRERLRLEDREVNLRRAAREHLAGVVRESFEAAREDVPSGVGASGSAALAVVRVADLDAPVVVARGVDAFGADAFDGVEALSRWLDSSLVAL
jgi:hypothetical protein